MRTDSRCKFRFSFALIGTICLLTSVGYGQVRESFQTIASVPKTPMEPSPLSQFSATTPLINQMNPQWVAGNWSSSSLPRPNATSVLVTKQVDLKSTLRKYAAYKKCSLNEAFAETVSFLKMVPLHDKPASEMVGAQAIYSIIEQDIYRISAQQTFFDALPMNLLCIANGKRNLAIDIHFLGIPEKNKETFKSMMVPGSFISFNNKIPQVTPYATTATYKDESDHEKLKSEPGGTFVVATETKTKVYPTFMGRMDEAGVKKLFAYLSSDENIRVTMAPSVVVLPGQTASIADASTRPFVVGVNRVDSEFSTAHQPVVQAIEEGTMLMLRATGENGSIRLDADLALSEIESVGTFAYSDSQPDERLDGSKKTVSPVTIQIPEQKLKQVHFSTLVEEGHTVFIDPVFKRNIQTRIEKRLNMLHQNPNQTKESKSRILLMIKPHWVEAN